MKALRARAGHSPGHLLRKAARVASRLPGWYIAYGTLALFNVALLVFSLWLNSREAHLLDATAKTYGLYADLLERVNEVAQIAVAADASTESQRVDAVTAVFAATRTIRSEQLAAIAAQRREANEAQKLVAALAMVAVLLTLAAAAHALHVHRAMRKQAALREHATRQLARAQEQAQQATRAKAQFLATMSHEIRTPMNGVLGMLDALSTTPLSYSQASLLKAANSSSDLLLSIIDAVLDFSLIDAGMLAIRNAPLDVRELTQQTVAVHAAQAREKKLTLKLEMAESLLPTVLSDAHRLSQVLSNLLGNAVKFTAAGAVTLRVEVLDEVAESLQIKFSVQDTGIGMDVDQQRKLFAPFTQGDASSNRRYGGIGLGLAICKQLTQLLDPHSGQIGVTSTLGLGSNFFLILRFAKAADQSHVRVASVAPVSDMRSQKFSGRVLVAEDNETNRQVVVAMLRKLGLQMTLVGNGLEAIEAVQRERYDLILMDYHMPELDGCDATVRIRRYEQEHALARTPIVAVTASVLASDRERCFAAGMDDFVAKPLRQQMLVAMLEKWLPEGVRRDDDSHHANANDPLASTWTNLPVELFDLEQLLEMRAIAGESFDELVEQFHGSASEGLAALRNALENHDWVALKRAAHKLKGAAATLGAKLVAARCHSLETASKEQSMDAAAEHLHCLEQEYSAVRRHMSACVSACAA